MRVAFMGTPEFAVPALRALLDAGCDVVAAFTQPDRPAGRGNKLTACPAKEFAASRGVPVFQFERIRLREGRETLAALRPDLCVTAAFGQILSQRVLDIPPLGTINVHASLLPRYRGPAPINWCIAMGERETGVTIMYTDAGIDTGDIVMARRTPIGELETAGELTERLSLLGAELLLEAIAAIGRGEVTRTPQDESLATHHPMLSREMGRIDWTLPAREIANRARGFNPWPGAYALLGGDILKIWRAKEAEGEHSGAPGEMALSDPKKGLIVACGEGALEIVELQAPGGKKMQASAFLLGKPIQAGTVLC